MKVGIVVPHLFMHRDILPKVLFAPGKLAVDLAQGLQGLGAEVTLFSPGPVDMPPRLEPFFPQAQDGRQRKELRSRQSVRNITADLHPFEQELGLRGDDYLDLLRKHPGIFISLARQVQSELIARAYDMANRGELDVVHIYSNEEDIALPFAKLCRRPVVFTHHDPFNFLVKYKHVFPKYAQLNWLSMSLAQRAGMPKNTNWVGNIYHGLDPDIFVPSKQPTGGYIAYLGRIIRPKGVHLAIAAVKKYNLDNPSRKLQLKIAGKHYAGHKDEYWQQHILPAIDGNEIEYAGFIDDAADKQAFLANASALIVPSTFEEPFGMVIIEALACGTPVIGLDSGAIPEIIQHGKTGLLVPKISDEDQTVNALTEAIKQIASIDRSACRQDFEARFTLERMCREHLAVYERLTK